MPNCRCLNPQLNQGPLNHQSNTLPSELFRPAIANHLNYYKIILECLLI